MASKFITISTEIMHDKKLSANQKFILAEIQQLSSLDNGCFASNLHFSELTGISRSGVSKAIKLLEEMQYIHIDRSNMKRNRGRIINYIDPIDSGQPPIDSGHKSKGNIQSNIQSNNKDIAPTAKSKSKKFVKPSVEEIKKYCDDRDNTISPEQFFDYNESKGWVVGRNPMKDWKAAIRTWERNNFNSKKQKDPLNDFDNNDTSWYTEIADELENKGGNNDD